VLLRVVYLFADSLQLNEQSVQLNEQFGLIVAPPCPSRSPRTSSGSQSHSTSLSVFLSSQQVFISIQQSPVPYLSAAPPSQ
jgi:hypothetical protein